MMSETTTAPAEGASIPKFSIFSEIDLRMAQDVIRAARAAFELTSNLSNFMGRAGLEDFSDDWSAALDDDLALVNRELLSRGLPISSENGEAERV